MQTRRMGGLMDLLELTDGYLSVDLGRRNVGMAKQRLNESQAAAQRLEQAEAEIDRMFAGGGK